MTNIEGLLERAGDGWRATQPMPPEIDPQIFSPRTRTPNWLVRFAAVAVAGALVVAVAATGLPGRSPGPGTVAAGGQGASASAFEPSLAASSSPAATACDVTRPDPTFVPPSPNPVYPGGASAWYGTPALWTMLDQAGATWEHLPIGPDGLTQQTFWWSTDWVPEANPVPSITVVGTQLDGPGAFTAGPGANASTPGGNAMLVGVTVPTPGCWRLTGTYLDASLSIVVDVKGD